MSDLPDRRGSPSCTVVLPLLSGVSGATAASAGPGRRPAAVQIDQVVALPDGWQKGAQP